MELILILAVVCALASLGFAQQFQGRFIQAGDSVDHTPAAVAVVAGQVAVVGSQVGIAKRAIPVAALGALCVRGVFDVVKINDEITDGAAIYWDPDGNPVNGELGSGGATTTPGALKFMGFAIGAAGAAAETVRVNLLGVVSVTANHYGPLNNLIADPGDAEAIPVTASGRVEVVTGAGAETNTLAAPTFGGQELLIGVKTKGAGSRVITVTGCDDGDTITLSAAGQAVLLVGVAKAAAFVWRAMADPDTLVTTAG